MGDAKEDELLNILQAHGEQFLGSFSLPEQMFNSRKRKGSPEVISARKKSWWSAVDERENNEVDDEEEWGGIIEHSAADGNEDFDVQPDVETHLENYGFRAESGTTEGENVVIFDDLSSNGEISNLTSKAVMKAFMSSKISKLRQGLPSLSKPEVAEADANDERSHAQNDVLLHRLVHTELLSGSSNPMLNLSAAQRRKALAARVLELSGGARLGKGERYIVEKERKKAAKHVREGLLEKQKAREKQELEEAKNLGNYHPTIKKLFKPSTGPTNAKRDRGLKLGVGKFSGGLLKLSPKEVSRAESGQRERSSNRGRHRRGGRG